MPGMQKIPEDVFLGAIEKLGPIQPIDLRKELKLGDTWLIGAMLSEFVSKSTLVISKTRRGGSPFYYFPDKPETLERISQYLNEKDRRTCALLKDKKVLREDAVEPLVRVGLQNIPDFSRKFIVSDVVYWRYYLIPEEEAIRIVSGEVPETPNLPKAAPQEIAKTTPSNIEEIKMPPVALEKAKKPRKKTVKKESVQETLPAQDWTTHDTLLERVQKFADKGVISQPVSFKAHVELTCVLTTDMAFGKLSYFVIALNKKKIAEKEVTGALLQARGRGMPLLVLTTEEMPAKMVNTFDGMSNVYFRKL